MSSRSRAPYLSAPAHLVFPSHHALPVFSHTSCPHALLCLYFRPSTSCLPILAHLVFPSLYNVLQSQSILSSRPHILSSLPFTMSFNPCKSYILSSRLRTPSSLPFTMSFSSSTFSLPAPNTLSSLSLSFNPSTPCLHAVESSRPRIITVLHTLTLPQVCHPIPSFPHPRSRQLEVT